MHGAMKRTYMKHTATDDDRGRQTMTDNDRHRQTAKSSTDSQQTPTGSTDSQQGPQTVNRVHRQRQTPSVDELGVSPKSKNSTKVKKIPQ